MYQNLHQRILSVSIFELIENLFSAFNFNISYSKSNLDRISESLFLWQIIANHFAACLTH